MQTTLKRDERRDCEGMGTGWDGRVTPPDAVEEQPTVGEVLVGADPTTPKATLHQLSSPNTPPSLAASRRVFDGQAARCAPPPTTPIPVRHDRSSPQQEPGSAKYLSRLLRLAIKEASGASPGQQRHEHQQRQQDRPPPPLMADFLASFGIGSDNTAPSHSGQCASLDDLSLRLRGELDQKTAPTRAEHVAVTIELRNTAQFSLGISDSENEALQAVGIGLQVGNGQPQDLSGGGMGGEPAATATRAVSANDALMHQSDNPMLQRTVAKYILAAVSAADGSNWTLRDLSRGAQGWTITYICRDSVQHWKRQNAKNPTNAVVGEYSHREPDPVLITRPAFDCRGSITITFNRSSRTIIFKYGHTPLHKTVDELSKLFPAPVRQPGPGYQRQQEQKTPKKPASERKKKRESNTAPDENGERPKKRPRKSKKKQSEGGEQSQSMDNIGLQPPGSQAQETSNYPEGPLDAQAQNNGGQSVQSPAGAPGSLHFNVTAEEAARRLAIARKLLSDAGVDPDTLSTGQMNIFANQSPELQKDSVAMLAKYGAERLQIIHPNDKDKTNQSSGQSSSGQATQSTPSGPMTTKELVPESVLTESKKKRKSNGAAAEDGTPSGRKLGKSRLACFSCKERKVKCPKDRPSCTECQEQGITCEYPPPKPRHRKSNAVITLEDDEGDEEQEGEQDPDPDPDQSQVEEAHDPQLQHPDVMDMPSHSQMPVAAMLTPSEEHQMHPSRQPPSNAAPLSYFQSASGLVLPQSNIIEPSQQQQAHPREPPPQRAASKRRSRKSQSASRHSLPMGSPQMDPPAVEQVLSEAPPPPANPWMGAGATDQSNNGHAQQPQGNQQRPRQSNRRVPNASPQMTDVAANPLKDTSGIMRAVPPAQPSPNMVSAMQAQPRRSPLQPPGHQRTDSRESRRSQSRTPNNVDRSNSQASNPPQQGSATTNSRARNQGNDMVASSNHNMFGRHQAGSPDMNDRSSARIAYEPYSQQRQQQATAYPSFDYRATATTSAPLYDSTMSTADQWSGNSNQVSRSYEKNSNYMAPGSFGQGGNPSLPQPQAPSSSLRNLDMRAATQQRPNSRVMNKAGYPSFSSQQQPGHHPLGQQSDWSYFNTENPHNYPPNASGWI